MNKDISSISKQTPSHSKLSHLHLNLKRYFIFSVTIAVLASVLIAGAAFPFAGAVLAGPPKQINIFGIHGMKFHDLNGNGQKEDGEPGLAGWTIVLIGEDGGFRETRTDEQGHYWFMDIPAGQYTVRERLEPGWQQTYPQDGAYTFQYDPSQAIDQLDFGNWAPGGSIHGTKFHDIDGNGQIDSTNEPGLPHWKITLKGNGFVRDTWTDDQGHYWFIGLVTGTYTLTEEIRPGWQQTVPSPPGNHTVVLQSNRQKVEGIDFANTGKPGEIHGVKFHDQDGNGVRDNTELGLEGWTIVIEGENGIRRETTTDKDGKYWFMDLPPGIYQVIEVLQNGWQQTFPRPLDTAPGFHKVELRPEEVIDGVDFGNWKPGPGEIHGVKFHDQDGNGVRDTGEPGLEGWTIFIESENGVKHQTTTDKDGKYWFMDLPPGAYRVTEDLQQGWFQTFPQAGFHWVMLVPNQVVDDIHFGNWKPEPGEIHGVKFHDQDGNGVYDPGEPGLEGWTIVLVGENGIQRETRTDADGKYWFMDLPPGAYSVKEILKDGWRQTFPPERGAHKVELNAGQVVDDAHFGNWEPGPGEIHGMKFHDQNGNGQHDAGEAGLAGWTIVLEGKNGFRKEATTDADGNYWFMDLEPSIYEVFEKPQEGWHQTFPPQLGAHRIELGPGQKVERILFGNWQPDPGEIHGMKFHDQNGNGQHDAGEPGLAGWTIVLEGKNGVRRETTTDADGNYWFMDLPPGTYFVVEVNQPDWQQTFPHSSDAHRIELGPGQKVERILFGNWQPKPGEIHGMKFHDQNGNGQKDTGESGLAGWTIVLEGENGLRQEATTDKDGNYLFMNLKPGPYEVFEKPQEGWQQTFPTDSRLYHIKLEAAQIVEKIDFGNWKPEPGSIHGMKFYDLNGDGKRDPNEPGLADWTIVIKREDGAVGRTTTDQDGRYWFMDLLPGKYEVGELKPAGWQQTYPASRTHTVTLSPGATVEDIDFGNWKPKPGSIHGTKFHDLNHNGRRDSGEPGLANWTIILKGEDFISRTVTNGNGQYWFTSLLPGSYKLAELAEWGWTQTFPTQTHTINLAPGQEIHQVDFGNWRRDLSDRDFCKIHWDIQFPNKISVDTKVRIFNTDAASASTYDLQLIGLPQGTHGSKADGPTMFDILDPIPITVPARDVGKVGIRIHYPDSFKNGDPGPARFAAIVTNIDTNLSFGCQAALWPVRNIRLEPADNEIIPVPVDGVRSVEFNVINTGDENQTRSLLQTNSISYTIYAMTDGEEDGDNETISLNGLPPGNTVSGQISVTPGTTGTVSVQVAFTKVVSDTTSDVLLEADLDGDGIPDAITASIIEVGEESDNPVYVPLIVR